MVDVLGEEGGTATLFCNTSGSPPPKVTWYKDGDDLVITDRHFVLPKAQRLFIVDLRLSDAGR